MKASFSLLWIISTSLLRSCVRKSQCGWLKDKFGLSWQIVPKALGELTSGPDPDKARRVIVAMLKMVKTDWPPLRWDGCLQINLPP